MRREDISYHSNPSKLYFLISLFLQWNVFISLVYFHETRRKEQYPYSQVRNGFFFLHFTFQRFISVSIPIYIIEGAAQFIHFHQRNKSISCRASDRRFYSPFYSNNLRGVTTLTNTVSGQSQNCSGNLEIFPGIGTLRNFSGKHVIILGHCRKKSGHQRRCIPKIREDDPNFRDD